MKNRIVKFFGGLFSASGKELGGLLIIGIIIIVGLFFVNWLDNYTSKGYQNAQIDQQILDSLIANMENEEVEVVVLPPINYVLFDPNTAEQSELEALGIDSTISARIIKYRMKGGIYRRKSDLKKIYGLPKEQFALLYPYIDLPVKEVIIQPTEVQIDPVLTNSLEPADEPASLPVFDLNLADTAVLQTIPGIGSIFANRIVGFRDKLGGFVNEDQLYQVYHLDSNVVDRLKKVCIIAPDFEPSTININEIEVKDLAAHPYVNWNQAKLIVAYRVQHGSFKQAADLIQVYSIDEPFAEKIMPYISFSSE